MRCFGTCCLVLALMSAHPMLSQWQRRVGPSIEGYRYVTSMVPDGRGLVCGTFESGVWELDPATMRWDSASQGLPAGDRYVYALASTREGIYASINERMYLRGARAQTWQAMQSWPQGRGAMYMCTQGNSVYAGGPKMGVYRIDGASGTWERATKDTALQRVNGLAMIGESLFLSCSSGLYVSNDRGGRWRRLEVTPTYEQTSFVIDVGDSVLLTVSDTDTTILLRSTDKGASWHEVDNAPPGVFRPQLLAESRGTAFLGTGSGMTRSMSVGEHWEPVNAGLEDALLSAEVRSVGISGGWVVAALSNGDVWRREASQLVVSVHDAPVGDVPFRIRRTMQSAVITLEPFVSGLRAEVYDVRGRLMGASPLVGPVTSIRAEASSFIMVRSK